MKPIRKAIKSVASKVIRSRGRARYKRRAADAEKALAALGDTPEAPIELSVLKGIAAAVPLPTSLEADLMINRRGAYVEPALDAMDAYLDVLFGLSPPDPVAPPSDRELIHTLIHGPCTNYMAREGDADVYFMDMSLITGIHPFHGVFEIVGVRIDLENEAFTFSARDGIEYGPDHPLYAHAKMHFLCCLPTFLTAIGHSWVHFHFPTIINALHFNLGLRRPDSVLYRLLAPHTRFSLALEDSVLRTENNSIDDKPGLIAKLNPVNCFPFVVDEFLNANASFTHNFYEPGGGVSFPHEFPTDLPYPRTANAFFEVVRAFVDDIAPHLERDLLDEMMREANAHLPGITDADALDVLATFIWQVSALHSSDHFSVFKGFRDADTLQDDITVWESRRMFPGIATRALEDTKPDTPFAEYVDPIYIDRTRHWLDVFTRFNHNPDPALDFTMRNLDYGFEEAELAAAVQKFQAALFALEERLISEGRLICPLQEMGQSICF